MKTRARLNLIPNLLSPPKTHKKRLGTSLMFLLDWFRRFQSFKQRRFGATHVNRKWLFFIFERWYCLYFQSNRLYKSKEAMQYKFYIVKAY